MKKALGVFMVMLMVVALSMPAWSKGPNDPAGTASTATPEQRQQFMKETTALRQSILDKQTQLDALLAKPASDPAQVGALQKEIYQLQEQLRDKAQKAGMACPMVGSGFKGMCGMGGMGGMGRMAGMGGMNGMGGMCGKGMGMKRMGMNRGACPYSTTTAQ